MKFVGFCCSIVGLATLSILAAPAPLAQQDVFKPAPANAVTFTGRLGEQLDLCLHKQLLPQSLPALVNPYRQKTEEGPKDWRCEYWGKWYTSLVLADAYQSTPETRAKCVEGYTNLITTAARDGYLGTRKPEFRLQGWDVWGRKYALLGILAYYDRTGDETALKVACRHEDTLLNEVGPGKTNIVETGEQRGLASSSVLEPTVLLYQRTGDPKYLAFAQYIVEAWSKPAKHMPHGLRLIEDATAHVPPEKMVWNKAYEMTSCFEGLCELYRVTGEKAYLTAAIGLADNVLQHETTIIGCGTRNEFWSSSHTNQTGMVFHPLETCVTATWMKYLYQLLRLTGDVRYADELERNLYNGLLGALMPDGSWWAYFSAPMGERVPSNMQHVDVGTSCCVLNGPRGLFITSRWAAMTSAEGPVINLYAPARTTFATPQGTPLHLEITGDYPATAATTITLNPQTTEEFTLALRIPAWSEKTELRVNDERIKAKAGTYARIRRTWKAGDKIKLTFDLRGRLLEAPDGNGQLAVVRGPIVFSLDNRLVPTQPGVSIVLDRSTTPFIALTPNPSAAQKIGAWLAFDAPCTINGQKSALTFCDYASAGTLWKETNPYCTWLPQPLDMGTIYETSQTWQTLSHTVYRPR
ncbi:MAG: hypothetical protein EPN23_08115 [Verrucomicrobia bacterium]|nr:MAG: hypothetical protein EPN23_08115 [Verrucomicrobiota bacterium]